MRCRSLYSSYCIFVPRINQPPSMKKVFFFLFLLLNGPLYAEASEHCNGWPRLLQPACKRIHQIWTQGDTELYLTGYAWHNRFTYDKARLATYNEAAWGGGLGKRLFDENGDAHALYAFAFLDSHKNVEPVVGYSFLKTAHLTPKFNVGAGIGVFITARPDIFNNIPFPGALPWISMSYDRATISATYIPGAKGAGNVLFIMGKWRF